MATVTPLRFLLPAVALALSSGAVAQTRSVRDTARAYGARLAAPGLPANLNERRLNSRIPTRLDNRLALRIERYRVDATDNPVAAYRVSTDDRSRTTPVVAPTPTPDVDAER